ncbi:MAG: ribonucleoside-diphosphate reductase, adenosylcobalamin-dependent [Planctomycetes bacterium]|jgi:ribonucleoside-diphosphate reductase alpha chain|nr:ribonucleoside-diphosphate reductase, adenosylcobalamin-dependent [Planctomycetota bacterium]
MSTGGGNAEAILDSIEPPAHLLRPELTDNALAVLERRYLRKDPETGKVDETPCQAFWRVATHVAKAELLFDDGTHERALALAEEFYGLMARLEFMPNSPTLMNAGRRMGMLSACFVLPVEDSIDGIFDAIKATALIQKAGGGTGFSFSRLRPRGDLVSSSGGTTEGPLSFIQVFSKATDAIQQGAFRRGANMGILRVDHPDIADFITFKSDLGKIENYNVSVAITDRFLEELKADPATIHKVQNPRTKQWTRLEKLDDERRPTGEYFSVGQLWDRVVAQAWANGEPGVVFIDRINECNPIKNVGLIEATNPCGEQPLHAYDSCNLGSINLGKYVRRSGTASATAKGTFDWEELESSVHACTRFLDNVIEVNKYPLPQIDRMSKTTRRIGLGVMGFADALYDLGIPYDSEEGLEFGEKVMRVVNEESHLASEALAEERGVFPAWEGSEWQQQNRRMRNSYCTTVAPTGTISIIAGCSGGIEPMFSLVFARQVMKDEQGRPTVLREVNHVFERIAQETGVFTDELADDLAKKGTLQHRDEINETQKRVFVTAHDITPEWHMRMQAAFQRHCDSSISKTINFPREASVDDVRKIYGLAIDLDVKGVTVYRDGCRDIQPMALDGSRRRKDVDRDETQGNGEKVPSRRAELEPIPLPEIMPSLRIRQMTPFGNMHVKVAVDPAEGCEREVFAQLGKGGDVANSDLEAVCRLLSLWLRAGGRLESALKQLQGIGSSLTVTTKDGRIMSLADGLARALSRYLVAKKAYGLEALLLGKVPSRKLDDLAKEVRPQSRVAAGREASYKIKCPSCTGTLSFEEGCVKCHGCGFSQC